MSTSNINAFATPDGSIRLYSGLINDDELLAVLRHEMAYVDLKHKLKSLKKPTQLEPPEKAMQIKAQQLARSLVRNLALWEKIWLIVHSRVRKKQLRMIGVNSSCKTMAITLKARQLLSRSLLNKTLQVV